MISTETIKLIVNFVTLGALCFQAVFNFCFYGYVHANVNDFFIALVLLAGAIVVGVAPFNWIPAVTKGMKFLTSRVWRPLCIIALASIDFPVFNNVWSVWYYGTTYFGSTVALVCGTILLIIDLTDDFDKVFVKASHLEKAEDHPQPAVMHSYDATYNAYQQAAPMQIPYSQPQTVQMPMMPTQQPAQQPAPQPAPLQQAPAPVAAPETVPAPQQPNPSSV